MKERIVQNIPLVRRMKGAGGEYRVTVDGEIGDTCCRGIIARLEAEGALPARPSAREPVEHSVALEGGTFYVWVFGDQVEIYRTDL